MMLVTGCAGFIGSHLTERLLKKGHKVVGIDNFSDYYSRKQKERNIADFIENKNFRFIEEDILKVDIENIMEGVDVVFHQAAQPGVRLSWGENFEVYTRNNVNATQRLLEACKGKQIKGFIYASSSSVYGDVQTMPIREDVTPKPVSPYGVSKLASENLCYLYHKNFGIPVTSLRYFTVYGPRQRPDMAFHRFIRAILKGEEMTLFGTGEQTRDFTYVSDIVEANILAMKSNLSGETFNIGGGSRISVNETISIIEHIIGKKAKIRHKESQRGDMKHTAADITKAMGIGYKPQVGIERGLEEQIRWLESV